MRRGTAIIGRAKSRPANKRRKVAKPKATVADTDAFLDAVVARGADLIDWGADEAATAAAAVAVPNIALPGERGQRRLSGNQEPFVQASMRAFSVVRPPTIENVVCRAKLDNQMVLSLLTLLMRGRFTPNTFPACMANSAMPSGSNVSFDTGTTIGLGTCNPMDCLLMIYKLLMRVYLDTNWVILPQEFRIENVVGSASIGKQIDLKRMYRVAKSADEPGVPRPGDVQYEPSLFPGLHLRIPGVSVRFICFNSGYLVLTGGRDAAGIVDAYNALVEKLEPFVVG